MKTLRWVKRVRWLLFSLNLRLLGTLRPGQMRVHGSLLPRTGAEGLPESPRSRWPSLLQTRSLCYSLTPATRSMTRSCSWVWSFSWSAHLTFLASSLLVPRPPAIRPSLSCRSQACHGTYASAQAVPSA